jgi:hypothetical protein
MASDPVSDDELLDVVFGDDKAKFSAYRRLFEEGG